MNNYAYVHVSKLCQISRSPETEKCEGRSYVSEGWASLIYDNIVVLVPHYPKNCILPQRGNLPPVWEPLIYMKGNVFCDNNSAVAHVDYGFLAKFRLNCELKL